jgi:hypothetical protein
MANLKNDVTGQKFSRLLVIDWAYTNAHRQSMWNCKCDCGALAVVLGNDLIRGHTRSCGCYNDERLIEFNTKHGLAHTKIGMIKDSMRQRCYNPKCKAYKHYGGRGITICDEWLEDPKSFFNWSFANGYEEGLALSIDRIDNDGPYSPENCQWTSGEVQGNNRRNNVLLTHNGITLSISQWAKKLGVRVNQIYGRKRRGWSDEKILTTPFAPLKKKRWPFLTFKGETKTQKEWANELGVSTAVINARLNRYGWSIEKTLTTPVIPRNKKKH